MLQLKGSIYNIEYEPFVSFLLQKLSPSAAPLLKPFLESVQQCTKEITEAITTTVKEEEIQNMIVYFANYYNDKLSNAIEKAFYKKGFKIEVNSLCFSKEENTSVFLVNMEFKVVSCSIKILTPFLSDKLFSRLLNIKPLTDALCSLIETAFKTQCHFAEIKELYITAK